MSKIILTFLYLENILFSCLNPWEVYIGFQKEDQRKTHRGGDRLVDECSNPGGLQVLHLAGKGRGPVPMLPQWKFPL
jgi:hypothetical protein